MYHSPNKITQNMKSSYSNVNFHILSTCLISDPMLHVKDTGFNPTCPTLKVLRDSSKKHNDHTAVVFKPGCTLESPGGFLKSTDVGTLFPDFSDTMV